MQKGGMKSTSAAPNRLPCFLFIKNERVLSWKSPHALGTHTTNTTRLCILWRTWTADSSPRPSVLRHISLISHFSAFLSLYSNVQLRVSSTITRNTSAFPQSNPNTPWMVVCFRLYEVESPLYPTRQKNAQTSLISLKY